MKISDPDIYFGKRIRVITTDGTIIVGKFDGYNYDYDDDGREYIEFDIWRDYDGAGVEFMEDEVESIEIIE